MAVGQVWDDPTQSWVWPNANNTPVGASGGGPAPTITAPTAGTAAGTQPGTQPGADPNAANGLSGAGYSIQNQALTIAVQAATQKATQAYQEALIQGATADRAEKAAEFAATNELAKQAQAQAQQAQNLAAQNQAYTQGMGVLNLVKSEEGPANAFTQQAVLHGLQANGLSRAVGALSGTALPTFQAPQATPQAASLQSLIGQVYPGATFNGAAGGTAQAGTVPSISSIMTNNNAWTGAPANTTAPGATSSAAGLSGNALTAYQVLTANNGSPAAGMSQDTFQAYMNTHNGTLPVDAYALANWAQQNPGVTAASTAQTMGQQTNYDAATRATNPLPTGAGQPAPQAYGQASPSGFQNGMQAADGTWYDAAKYPNGPPTSTGAAGAAGQVAMSPGGGSGGVLGTQIAAPGTGGATTADYVNGLPAPNKIVSRNFNALDPDTQQFLLGAYRQAGYSNNDVTNAVKQTLPTFTAPSAGQIAA